MTFDCLTFLKPRSITVYGVRITRDADQNWFQVCKEIKKVKFESSNDSTIVPMLKILGNQLKSLILEDCTFEENW